MDIDAATTQGLLHEPEGDDDLLLGQTEAEPDKSIWYLIGLAIIFGGIQFGWALQIAYTTPIFEELGVDQSSIPLVWLAGPISGFFVQPIAGSLSDRCTWSYGRRRPFMVIGCILITIGLLMLSNAELIGMSIGPYMGLSTAGSKSLSTVLAIIGFWVLDVANNAAQGPCRALLMDKAPKQQATANAVLAVCLSVGNLSGYFIGSQGNVLLRWMPFFRSTYRILFTLSAALLLITCTVTAFVAKERQHVLTKEQLAINRPLLDLPRALWKAIVGMPGGMRRVCLVQFMTWLAYFTFLIYMSAWMTSNVFDGLPASNPKATPDQIGRFQQGVSAGALGLALQSVVTLIVSMLVPPLMRCVGVKPVYAGGLVCLALMLGSTFFINGNTTAVHYIAITAVAFSGVAWAVVITVPFVLVAETSSRENGGVNMGVMNVFVVLPQFLISLSAGPLVKATGDPSTAMLCGAAFALIGAGLVALIQVPRRNIDPIDRLRLHEGEVTAVPAPYDKPRSRANSNVTIQFGGGH